MATINWKCLRRSFGAFPYVRCFLLPRKCGQNLWSDVSKKQLNRTLAIDVSLTKWLVFGLVTPRRVLWPECLNNFLSSQISALGDSKKLDPSIIRTVTITVRCIVVLFCLVTYEFVDINSTLVVDLATYAAHSPDSLWRTLFLGDCYWWAIYLDPQICLTQCISHQANIMFYAIIIFLRRWPFVSLAPTFSCIASTCEGLDWKVLYATSLVYLPHYVAYVKMRQFSST